MSKQPNGKPLTVIRIRSMNSKCYSHPLALVWIISTTVYPFVLPHKGLPLFYSRICTSCACLIHVSSTTFPMEAQFATRTTAACIVTPSFFQNRGHPPVFSTPCNERLCGVPSEHCSTSSAHLFNRTVIPSSGISSWTIPGC